MTARDLRAEFVRLVRANNKTAVFITHQISEAMEIGDRVLVCHRPARIAFEAKMGGEARDAERERIRQKILDVLSIEAPEGDQNSRSSRP
jgi:NitT/TauT family transport system ATP-binding protein